MSQFPEPDENLSEPRLRPVDDPVHAHIFQTAIYDPVETPGKLNHGDLKALLGLDTDQDVHLVTAMLLRCAGEDQNYIDYLDSCAAKEELVVLDARDAALHIGTAANLAKAESDLNRAQHMTRTTSEKKAYGIFRAEQKINTINELVKSQHNTIASAINAAEQAIARTEPYETMHDSVVPFGQDYHKEYAPGGKIDRDRVETEIYDPTDELSHPSLDLLGAVRRSSQGEKMAPPAGNLLRFILKKTLLTKPDDTAA